MLRNMVIIRTSAYFIHSARDLTLRFNQFIKELASEANKKQDAFEKVYLELAGFKKETKTTWSPRTWSIWNETSPVI
jgi:uncharacterized protein YxeA